MTAQGFLWVLGAFLLALGLLIVIHELGHYAAARLCNVKVLRFSVGFGRPLWMRRFGPDGTEWALAAFPLGGYVKMLDEREGDVPAGELPRAFNRQSVGRRSLIVVAGPLANLLLAVLLYWFLFMNGVEEPRPVFAAPPAGTLAAEVKVGAGETARAVSGTPVNTWTELRWELLRRVLDRETVVLETIDAHGHIAVYRLEAGRLDSTALDADVMQALGLHLLRPDLPAILGAVQAGTPAAAAGLQPGDRIQGINGRAVASWHELVRGIREFGDNPGGNPIELDVLRGEQALMVRLVPEMVEERGGQRVPRIGIAVRDDPELRKNALVTVRYGMGDSLRRALTQTWEVSVLSLRMIGRMLMGELSVKNISGPVTIADYAGQSARLGGDHYLRFLALISISIGVLNLLPIPVLDGGHLMYYLAEVIKGGPLSERVMEIGQQIGFALLFMLMALAFYNDIVRLFS
ncbi:MAG: RIP metalloprotease RseP [Rhodocyclaceae bacterium]|nr:RIP metalloprotease RseP [Rhodocyclaceae bacterium]MDP2195416.1 RIP metalloprotease RseP [Rhodocyclaceae bacterium]